jgi:hypothetical protein
LQTLPAHRLAPAPARRLAIDRDRLAAPQQCAGERQLEVHPVDQEAHRSAAAQGHQGGGREQRLEGVVVAEGEDRRVRNRCQTVRPFDADAAEAHAEDGAQQRAGRAIAQAVQLLPQAPDWRQLQARGAVDEGRQRRIYSASPICQPRSAGDPPRDVGVVERAAEELRARSTGVDRHILAGMAVGVVVGDLSPTR